MENKPESLLVVSLGKTLGGISPVLSGKQMADNYLSDLTIWLLSLSRDKRIKYMQLNTKKTSLCQIKTFFTFEAAETIEARL